METLHSVSDAELLRRAVAGEEEAFVVLYGRLKGGIFRYAFHMTSSKTAAEEVTQEVFMSLLKEAAHYRRELGDVGAFAFGIARNFVRRIERRERAYQPFPVEDGIDKLAANLPSEPEGLAGKMIRNEAVQHVQAAIRSLPDHYRQAVVLCDLCEFSYAEAAARLHCAVGTVRSRLNRAHALLAEKLKALRSPQASMGAAGPEGCLV